jgi:hypothetical protein
VSCASSIAVNVAHCGAFPLSEQPDAPETVLRDCGR